MRLAATSELVADIRPRTSGSGGIRDRSRIVAAGDRVLPAAITASGGLEDGVTSAIDEKAEVKISGRRILFDPAPPKKSVNPCARDEILAVVIAGFRGDAATA